METLASKIYGVVLAVVFVVCLIGFLGCVIIGMIIGSSALSNIGLLPALVGVINLCLIYGRSN